MTSLTRIIDDIADTLDRTRSEGAKVDAVYLPRHEFELLCGELGGPRHCKVMLLFCTTVRPTPPSAPTSVDSPASPVE